MLIVSITLLAQAVVRQGVGYHHAALDGADRTLVESLFRNMDLLAVCTTSTLAVGVNLPAHCEYT